MYHRQGWNDASSPTGQISQGSLTQTTDSPVNPGRVIIRELEKPGISEEKRSLAIREILPCPSLWRCLLVPLVLQDNI